MSISASNGFVKIFRKIKGGSYKIVELNELDNGKL